MKKFISTTKEVYRKQWEYFKKDYKTFFWISAILFFAVFAASYLFFLNYPQILKNLFEILDQYLGWIKQEKFGSGGMFLAIFANNLKASFTGLLSGLLPLFFIPLLYLIVNGATLGLVMAGVKITGLGVLKLFIVAVLPHAIFELPALFFAVALGIFLCLQISRKFLGLKSESFRKTISQVFWSFVYIVIPFLFLAALIENFITPLISR